MVFASLDCRLRRSFLSVIRALTQAVVQLWFFLSFVRTKLWRLTGVGRAPLSFSLVPFGTARPGECDESSADAAGSCQSIVKGCLWHMECLMELPICLLCLWGKWLETELLKAASGGSLERGRERRGVEENRAVPSTPEARTVVPPPSSGVRYLFWDLERS